VFGLLGVQRGNHALALVFDFLGKTGMLLLDQSYGHADLEKRHGMYCGQIIEVGALLGELHRFGNFVVELLQGGLQFAFEQTRGAGRGVGHVGNTVKNASEVPDFSAAASGRGLEFRMTCLCRVSVLLLLAAGAALQLPAAAQSYPSRTVRIIAPIAPGGATDVFARTLAAHLAEAWGQQVVVDNRPGAGGMIGSELVAKAPPDGYALLMAYTSHVVNPSLWTRLPYDTLRDFAPVTMVAEVPSVLLLHPSLPVKTVPELVQFARRRPHELDYGSSGIATAAHMAAALFAQRTGLFLTHVPYKGGVPALYELIGGQISILFGSVTTAVPAVRAGRVRALAVTSLKRSPVLPELPTMAEAALPGYEAIGWFALFAPAQTSGTVIHRISTETLLMLKQREIRERFLAHGAEFQPSSPGELDERVRREIVKWRGVLRAAGVVQLKN